MHTKRCIGYQPREEPDAEKPHVRICRGADLARGQSTQPSLFSLCRSLCEFALIDFGKEGILKKRFLGCLFYVIRKGLYL